MYWQFFLKILVPYKKGDGPFESVYFAVTLLIYSNGMGSIAMGFSFYIHKTFVVSEEKNMDVQSITQFKLKVWSRR